MRSDQYMNSSSLQRGQSPNDYYKGQNNQNFATISTSGNRNIPKIEVKDKVNNKVKVNNMVKVNTKDKVKVDRLALHSTLCNANINLIIIILGMGSRKYSDQKYAARSIQRR